MKTKYFHPAKLAELLVKHHWKKQEYVWRGFSAVENKGVTSLEQARPVENSGRFEWWNRGTDSLLVYVQDTDAIIFTPRGNIARYIVGAPK